MPIPKIVLIAASLLLAGGTTALVSAGYGPGCDTSPPKEEHLAGVALKAGSTYLYLAQGSADATKAGVWEETNGWGHLQTDECLVNGGLSRVYSQDRHVGETTP